MALVYYFVKTGSINIDLVNSLDAAITSAGLTINHIVANYWELSPRSAYLSAIPISLAPSVVGIDDTDDTLMGQTDDPDTMAAFKAGTDAAYAAKHPTP